jgi:hypothetical protein
MLVDYAREHGARGLRADVLVGNSPMLRIFERGDHSLEVTTDAGVAELRMLFAQETGASRSGGAPESA